MTERTTGKMVEGSFARCQATQNFLETFYEKFTSSSPEIRKLFEHTDMMVQTAMLRGSLYMMMYAAVGSEIAARHLRELGHRHNELGVSPYLYDLWLESLLEAVEECDPMHSLVIEETWRKVLGRGLEIIKAAGGE